MKRFHMLLLASAMLLPIGTSVASAQMPYISGVPDFPGDKYSCSDEGVKSCPRAGFGRSACLPIEEKKTKRLLSTLSG
jgi:hypothetical protein